MNVVAGVRWNPSRGHCPPFYRLNYSQTKLGVLGTQSYISNVILLKHGTFFVKLLQNIIVFIELHTQGASRLGHLLVCNLSDPVKVKESAFHERDFSRADSHFKKSKLHVDATTDPYPTTRFLKSTREREPLFNICV